MSDLRALILAGGSGTRFWPLSRRLRPKQLLALDGECSLLRATVERLAPRVLPRDVWICTTRALAEAVRAELPEVPPEQVLVEPEGRNTAPAIGWSLISMPPSNGVVAVLPADHRVAAEDGFRAILSRAADVAAGQDRIVTLGVRPHRPETGFGYLELGADDDGVCDVVRFTEKPDLETAERWFQAGSHLWNAGIFVFRGSTLLGHLKRLEPDIGRGLDEITADPSRTDEVYPRLPSISIDYAVMERLDDIVALPLDCGWSDLGSWEALTEVLPAGEDGNRTRGDVVALDARDNLLWADQGTVAVVGVSGLVVVRTGDSVLVMPRERSQDVRQVVEVLRSGERHDRL